MFTSCIRSNFLADSSAVGSTAMALALFTHTSTPPNRCTAASTARRTSSSRRTSPTTASAFPPAASTSAAAVCTVPGRRGCGVSVLASSTTLAPRRAAAIPMARPMPRLPPEITTVRSVSELSAICLL